MKETNKLGRFEKISRDVLIATSKMLKDAKNELFDGIHGRVLEVGAGIGVNVHFFNRPEVEHWVPLLFYTVQRGPLCITSNMLQI